jgi:hypothetical protein
MVIGKFSLFVLAVFIILIWVLFEVKRMRHRLFAIFFVGFMLFTYFSAYFVFQSEDINYKTIPGLISAGKIYFSWLSNVFGNLKIVTANVIQMDWGSNSSLSR